MKSTCKRCNKPFTPEDLFKTGRKSICCVDCMFRNLMDALGFPTPPEFLDRHTKHPTLTEAEYQRKLGEVNVES